MWGRFSLAVLSLVRRNSAKSLKIGFVGDTMKQLHFRSWRKQA
jgi:hypothetical protein